MYRVYRLRIWDHLPLLPRGYKRRGDGFTGGPHSKKISQPYHPSSKYPRLSWLIDVIIICRFTTLSRTTIKQWDDRLGIFGRNQVDRIQRCCAEVSLFEAFQYPFHAFIATTCQLKKLKSQPNEITGANSARFDQAITQVFCRSLRP